MDEDTCTNLLNWFCSSLRNNENILAHYTNGLKGMGDYLRTKCGHEFYKIILSVVKRMKITDSQQNLGHLLNCCMWKIGAKDHEFMIRSGLLEFLFEGNGKKEINNPVIYEWEKITCGYECNSQPTFSDFFYQILEYYTISIFGRLLSDNDKHLPLGGVKSKETGQNTLQKAFSTINSQAVEVLLNNIMRIIFTKIDIFARSFEAFVPTEWSIYSKYREHQDFKGVFNTDQGLFKIKKEKEIKEENKKEMLIEIRNKVVEHNLSKGGSMSKYFENSILVLRLVEEIS